jgi:hypothetical protein
MYFYGDFDFGFYSKASVDLFSPILPLHHGIIYWGDVNHPTVLFISNTENMDPRMIE